MSKNRKKQLKIKSLPNETNDLSQDIKNVFLNAFQLHQKGNILEAAKLYRMVLDVAPDHADSLHLLGLILNQNGETEAACDLIKRAIQMNSSVPLFHYNLARIYQVTGRLEPAIKSYKKATKLKHDYGEAFENLGAALQDSGYYPAAKESYLKAMKLNPESALALHNMGTLLKLSGKYDEAIKYFDRALLCNPVLAEAHGKKAEILLSKGVFSEGWKESPWFYSTNSFIEKNPVRLIPFSKWGGASLKGRRLLVNADQGIGDEIMFVSCLYDVIEQAACVAIECDPRLVTLYQRSFPDVEIISREKSRDFYWTNDLGMFDCRISLSELPRFYRKNEDKFPVLKQYLQVDQGLKDSWNLKLKELAGKVNIGISWRGGVEASAKAARSIPLKFWKKIFHNNDVNFINLQYGRHDEEIDSFHQQGCGQLHSLKGIDPLTDLDGFCALISALDLVISIDNSTVHFAGAIGMPVWILLPFCPAWRWMYDRKDSLWYRSATLYRPDKTGLDGQKELLRSVAEELKGFLETIPAERASEKEIAFADADSLDNAEKEGRVITRNQNKAHALLLNDTSSWYHWGCTCTSLAIHDQLRLQWDAVVSIPIYATRHLNPVPNTVEQFDDQSFFEHFCAVYPDIIDKIRRAGAVYINGEDTLHNINQSTLGLLYLAYIAKTKLDRRVSIINHSCYPDGNHTTTESQAYIIYRKVYEQMDFIAVREVVSNNLLTSMELSVSQSFDCLPLYIEKYYQTFTQPENQNIIIAGSVSWGDDTIKQVGVLIEKLYQYGFTPRLLIGANAYPAADDIHMVQALKKHIGSSCELVYAWSESEWLRTIDNAALLISGRFHHTIAAAFLRTPFLTMGSNTKKNYGLLEMLGIPTYISVKEKELSEVLFESAIKLTNNPMKGILNDVVREKLLDLSMKNFLRF